MSSKEEILANIRRHTKTTFDMPDMAIEAIRYPDKVAQFIDIMHFVGGNAVELGEGEDINKCIAGLYPLANTIASNLPGITIATLDPDDVKDPRELNGTDLAVIRGEIGVAENGCVWIPQNVREKAIYFIAENLVILLDRKNLVNNMHEAYARLEMNTHGFGVFISGPSKTADIEQSLVVGAHGARGVTVVLM